MGFIFKCFVTLIASLLSFQMGHGNEVGSPDATSSSNSRSRI